MKATNVPSFNLESSLKRIDAILNADNKQFEEANSIPSREKLTYTNGFYVNCAALFVDIRESSTMANEHRRPVLAKVYRSFISEIVALFNENNITKEVNIHGDCVWCVCDTPYKSDIDELFSMAARACSMVDILNYKLKKKGFTTYSVGVGMDYGRALMIKAGCDGSGINDVIWMGDVVNQACHLCNDANSGYFDKRVFLSNVVYNNLNEDNQKLCSKDVGRDIYQANIVNITMNNWLKEQK
jgi:class 3 adenylate cyclase